MNQTRQTNASHTFLAAHAIKQLREERGLTQRALAESLGVTDKAVSKWESGRGLPDISLVEPLAQRLGISVAELLAGDIRANANRAGNMLKGVFYVCPICGNVVHALGEGSFSCCGSTMFPPGGRRAGRGPRLFHRAHRGRLVRHARSSHDQGSLH